VLRLLRVSRLFLSNLLIHKGKRDVEDLNLLCRVCNSIDHLERVYGKIGLRVVWDKQVKKE